RKSARRSTRSGRAGRPGAGTGLPAGALVCFREGCGAAAQPLSHNGRGQWQGLRMSDQQAQPPGGAVTTGMRFALFTCATILFIGMLYVARDFFMPIVLAILIFLTLSPIVRAGRYRGIPPFITGTVVVVGLGCAILAGMALLTRPI